MPKHTVSKEHAVDARDVVWAGDPQGRPREHQYSKTAGIIQAEKDQERWNRRHLSKCTHCGDPKPNHLRRACPKKDKHLPCYICGGTDHLRKNCPLRSTPVTGLALNSRERRHVRRQEMRDIQSGNLKPISDWGAPLDEKYRKRQTKTRGSKEEERPLGPKRTNQHTESKRDGSEVLESPKKDGVVRSKKGKPVRIRLSAEEKAAKRSNTIVGGGSTPYDKRK